MGLIGANLPDFDHNIKKINLYKMEIVGLILFISFYIANLPYFIGIILCILPIIFYFSNHRGFTHSLIGIIILSILIFLIVVMAVYNLSPFLTSFGLGTIENTSFPLEILPISLIIIVLAILTLNKKIITPFLVLFLIGILFFPEGFSTYSITFYNGFYSYIHSLISIIPITSINPINIIFNYNFYVIISLIFLPLFLGFLSHLILDSLTPAGIELFRPISSKKIHKKFAITSMIFLAILAISNWIMLFFN